jgi:2-oxo-4-hydroxy-4-carboxy-5-ureidoimidazoline decarboxylase
MTAAGLIAFNALDGAAVEAALLECCSSTDWASRVAAGRPYADAESLYLAADSAVHDMDSAAMAQALAGHPRIGERPAGPGHPASRREQAGVTGADQRVLDAIARGNADYEQRFGHVYLVCATGRSADELLGILHSRLGNDPAIEDTVTRTELAKINRIRLARLLEGVPG